VVLAAAVAAARFTGIDGVLVDLHYIADDPQRALDLAAQFEELVDDA
jgi:hypothetical protein